MFDSLQIISRSRHGVSVQMYWFPLADCQTLKIYMQAVGAGQTHHRFHNYLLSNNIVTALTVRTLLIVATLAFIVLCRMTNAPPAESARPKMDTSHRLLSWRTQNFRLLLKLPDSSVE